MKKFLKQNWDAMLFPALIIAGNSLATIYPENSLYFYKIGTAIMTFLLLIWLLYSNLQAHGFKFFVILTGVVSALKGIFDAVAYGDDTSHLTIEVTVYAIIYIAAIIFFVKRPSEHADSER